jgi:hypothetical protein
MTTHTEQEKPVRELTEEELSLIAEGFFASHAITQAINSIGKALATMAQKQ